MLLWGFWALLALHSPASSSSSAGSPAPFAVGLGLAVLAAVLLVAVAAASLPLPLLGSTVGFSGKRSRVRSYRIPRLSDPDAAGRPRPRAPSSLPAVI
jgi:hypothetical protein